MGFLCFYSKDILIFVSTDNIFGVFLWLVFILIIIFTFLYSLKLIFNVFNQNSLINFYKLVKFLNIFNLKFLIFLFRLFLIIFNLCCQFLGIFEIFMFNLNIFIFGIFPILIFNYIFKFNFYIFLFLRIFSKNLIFIEFLHK